MGKTNGNIALSAKQGRKIKLIMQCLCVNSWLQGVRTKLEGETMLNFLEKLVYMILPNQIGFEGIAPFQVRSSTPKGQYRN